MPEQKVGKGQQQQKKILNNSLLYWTYFQNLHFLVTGLLATKYYKSILISRKKPGGGP